MSVTPTNLSAGNGSTTDVEFFERQLNLISKFWGLDSYADHTLFEGYGEAINGGLDLIEMYVQNPTLQSVAGGLFAAAQIPIGLGLLADQASVTAVEFVRNSITNGMSSAYTELDGAVSTAIVGGVEGIKTSVITFADSAWDPNTSPARLAFQAGTLGGLVVGFAAGGTGAVSTARNLGTTLRRTANTGTLVLSTGDVVIGAGAVEVAGTLSGAAAAAGAGVMAMAVGKRSAGPTSREISFQNGVNFERAKLRKLSDADLLAKVKKRIAYVNRTANDGKGGYHRRSSGLRPYDTALCQELSSRNFELLVNDLYNAVHNIIE